MQNLTRAAIALAFFLTTLGGAETLAEIPCREFVTLPDESGQFCGVAALYACLRSLGMDIDIDDLWSPRYITEDEGSSAAQIIDAAAESNAYAVAAQGLTVHALFQQRPPCLLHVRGKKSSGKFNHWVAMLGFDGTKAVLADSNQGGWRCSPSELMAMWDGYCIIISDTGVNKGVRNLFRKYWSNFPLLSTR